MVVHCTYHEHVSQLHCAADLNQIESNCVLRTSQGSVTATCCNSAHQLAKLAVVTQLLQCCRVCVGCEGLID